MDLEACGFAGATLLRGSGPWLENIILPTIPVGFENLVNFVFEFEGSELFLDFEYFELSPVWAAWAGEHTATFVANPPPFVFLDL